MMSGSAFLLVSPMLFLLLTVGPGLAPALVSALVTILWTTTVLEHGSLWSNRALREASQPDLRRQHRELSAAVMGFVGICTPGYMVRQMWHSDIAHEDVGMLSATFSSLVFTGDSMTLSLDRSSILSISTHVNLWNPSYSWFGLHWIRVAYGDVEAPSHLFLQSRDRDRLSQLPRCNQRLLARLRAWHQGQTPQIAVAGAS